ncbi:Chlorophyll a/b-binding family protein [Heracleum sosnowskyi]|uniref:Chlorophyll a/b-binding family protein n=1 Tax=Heracleum sosnowskyi TaxID=360622 RepID=A0AAD8JJ36_9APIA|nr:Chlorophyll a/b-binding family protein [Heracleum sosnowskyi]
MGRESSDQTMTHSSLVLLQERFRQLQRVKEMRQEKEMLRLFSESDRCTSPPSINYNTHNHKPSNLFFQSELLRSVPPKVAAPVIVPSSHITCLSLWPDVSDNTKKAHWIKNKTWLPNKSTTTFYDVDDHDNECDVDTSLHL